MRLIDIAKIPTVIKEIPDGYEAIHESIFRAYNILQKVKHLLKAGVPAAVILELIGEMESGE